MQGNSPSSTYQSPWRGSMVMAPSGRNATWDKPRHSHRQSLSTCSIGGTQEVLPPDVDIMDGLIETALRTINVPEEDPDQEKVEVKDSTYIGSYNWLKGDAPAILVPGSPPQWQNRSTPYNIPPDTGIYFSDQNGYRMPRAVLLPLIAAVNKQVDVHKRPEFDWASVDIVTDRNNLRKLTRWVSGQTRDFRIDLQLAGKKTILMNRWEGRKREYFTGRTYGFSFEKASTEPAPGCKESTGHHRIITYDLNGLKMVVRFEVDACIPPVAKYPRRSIASMSELTSSLNALSLAQADPALASSSPLRSNQLRIFEGGIEVSSTSVIELTTRSQLTIKQYGFNWKEAYPQLFFSQTAHHFLAIHQRGRFVDVQKRKLMSEQLQAVEEDVQVELKKVRKALDVIREIVLEHGLDGRLSLVCVEGELKVYKRQSDESCLPESALRLFESS
ncbi:hypothetical protein D9613_005790 [Agrocybe pediades]|uniref:Geranylgeranyl pyrophosphate synthetase n=1 Tax=Agrocybe pediades TaxID=84607 RepID=A0A8H4QUD3_9AGAR|nr:hypothetical protein D9613_005790 [Agrocybe pediades]